VVQERGGSIRAPGGARTSGDETKTVPGAGPCGRPGDHGSGRESAAGTVSGRSGFHKTAISLGQALRDGQSGGDGAGGRPAARVRTPGAAAGAAPQGAVGGHRIGEREEDRRIPCARPLPHGATTGSGLRRKAPIRGYRSPVIGSTARISLRPEIQCPVAKERIAAVRTVGFHQVIISCAAMICRSASSIGRSGNGCASHTLPDDHFGTLSGGTLLRT